MLDSKAGLDRTAEKFADGDYYTFATFEQYGWTRSLSADWMSEVP